jgi:hypothetical protein
MEALTRLVAESLARHGLDRPVDPRRLQWSRWSRCDSPHSLLVVPSKPGIFALAEEIMDFSAGNDHVGTAALGRPAERSSTIPAVDSGSAPSIQVPQGRLKIARHFSGGKDQVSTQSPVGTAEIVGGHDFGAEGATGASAALAAEGARRMLAVLQFSEDDDMAFVLDRMFTRPNPLRTRLSSGLCFLRFVVIADQSQRRSICSALNQWLISSAEKASGLGPDFASSLEVTESSEGSVARAPSPANADRSTSAGRTLPSANAGTGSPQAQVTMLDPKTDPTHPALNAASPHLDSGAASNIHCPQPLPSGF